MVLETFLLPIPFFKCGRSFQDQQCQKKKKNSIVRRFVLRLAGGVCQCVGNEVTWLFSSRECSLALCPLLSATKILQCPHDCGVFLGNDSFLTPGPCWQPWYPLWDYTPRPVWRAYYRERLCDPLRFPGQNSNFIDRVCPRMQIWELCVCI